MSWFKVSRWLLVGIMAAGAASACGGRGNLPTGEGDAEASGAPSFGGKGSSMGAAAGTVASSGVPSFGGTVTVVGGSFGIAGTASVGGGPAICVPGRGMCEGNSMAICVEPGNGYVLRDCGPGQRCVQLGDVPSCGPVVCKPGQMLCDAAGRFVQVCSPDGTGPVNKLDCGRQGQRCQDGLCRSLACQPNHLYCDKAGVRLCNADGSGSTPWEDCVAGQYCDSVALACKRGICAPGQPACNGTVATTCNAIGSGYLAVGVDCGAQPDRQCVSGACLCPPSLADCDGLAKTGCESNVSTDPDNCTGCGLACSANHVAKRTCADRCDGTCANGFQDCNGDKLKDGCETTTASDVKNCGGCGLACSNSHVMANCSGGVCDGACVANFADCNGDKLKDGCESDTRVDAKNCGSCGNVCPDGDSCAGGKCGSLVTFLGIARDISLSSLNGWSQCYGEAYGEAGTSLSAIKATCTGSLLMMACRPVGSDVLQLAAYAPREDVLYDTGVGNEPHVANGVAWYFNGSQSWGFAPVGVGITRNSCDTQDSSNDANGTDGDLRLCWHTDGDSIQGGWRCGYNDGLNGSLTYERLLFHAP